MEKQISMRVKEEDCFTVRETLIDRAIYYLVIRFIFNKNGPSFQ